MAEATVIIKGARLAFPDLWVPVEYQKGDGKPRFSANLLLPKDSPQIAEIKALGLKMFMDEFKDKGKIHFENAMGDSKLNCLTDGDRKAYDGYAGHVAVTAYRRVEAGKPKVKDRDLETDLHPADGKPYAGCYVNTKISLWVQNNPNGKALRAGLDVVQFVRDGEAFSGAAPATTDGMSAETEEEAASMV